MEVFCKEEQQLAEAIVAARKMQEFLWGEYNGQWNIEEWRRMFRKRIQKIDDILSGNGVFAKAGEEIFDDYWANFGKIVILVDGKRKKLSSFEEYLQYRGLPMNLNNPKAVKRKAR